MENKDYKKYLENEPKGSKVIVVYYDDGLIQDEGVFIKRPGEFGMRHIDGYYGHNGVSFWTMAEKK